MTDRFGSELGQSSKADVIPRDHILLTGDSYAEGLGDAILSVGAGSRGPYASAHFIAARLGRDVMSVGRSGWGSVSSALAPSLFAQQAGMSIRYPVPPPSAIVCYFYEGNDLDDTLRWAKLGRGADFAARPYSAAEIVGLWGAQRDVAAAPRATLGRFAQANFPVTIFTARASDCTRAACFPKFSAAATPTKPRPGPLATSTSR